jgi:transcription elongation factor SPT5
LESTNALNTVSTNDRISKNDSVSNSISAESAGRHAVSGFDSNAIGAADDEVAPVWFMERVCVQLKKNSMTAVIKEINGSMAVIELEDHTTMNVGSSEVSMVAPMEHDSVLVTGGVDVGFEGELACIDGSDAILKDVNEDFKIVDYIHLAKIVVEN